MAIDAPSLQQQLFNGGNVGVGSVPFLLWFSGGGNSSSPAVFKATYLKSNTYDGGVIELPSEVSDVLESDPRGRWISISEAVHVYRIHIPRQAVPEGTTQIHAMPLFVEWGFGDRPPIVVIKMFDQGLNLGSPEFEKFSESITQRDR
jgi:hypothetical protein